MMKTEIETGDENFRSVSCVPFLPFALLSKVKKSCGGSSSDHSAVNSHQGTRTEVSTGISLGLIKGTILFAFRPTLIAHTLTHTHSARQLNNSTEQPSAVL